MVKNLICMRNPACDSSIFVSLFYGLSVERWLERSCTYITKRLKGLTLVGEHPTDRCWVSLLYSLSTTRLQHVCIVSLVNEPYKPPVIVDFQIKVRDLSNNRTKNGNVSSSVHFTVGQMYQIMIIPRTPFG